MIFMFSNLFLMDLVFPLSESYNDHIELKYCLRSVQKYLSEVDNIFIIGVKPTWIKGITHIVYSDMPGIRFKEANIFRKTHKACTMEDVSPDFLFMNDDIFLLSGFKTSQFPNFYHGNLQTALQARTIHDPYQYTVIYTMKYLMGMRAPIYDYDIHCPIIYNKEKYIKALSGLTWIRPYGFCIKSLYANLNKVEGVEYPDLKFRRVMPKEIVKQQIKGRYFFSTDERYINNDLIDILNGLYPKKSKYEL